MYSFNLWNPTHQFQDPAMQVYLSHGARPDVTVFCLVKARLFDLAHEHAESLTPGSRAADENWSDLSKGYGKMCGYNDGPEHKGPGSVWDMALECARQVSSEYWLKTAVWCPIFENCFKRGMVAGIEFEICEEAGSNCDEGQGCMDMLANEYRRVGNVAGAERCEARAVVMRSEETREAYHRRIDEGMGNIRGDERDSGDESGDGSSREESTEGSSAGDGSSGDGSSGEESGGDGGDVEESDGGGV